MLSTDLVKLMLGKGADGLPQDIRHKTKLHIIDTLGIALAAARGSPVADKVCQSLGFGQAAGNARLIGRAQRLPPAFAAMANSALCHTMDFDDIHDLARVHPTSITLPSALAAAAVVPQDATRIMEAVALGNELMCRLGVMLKALGQGPGSGWFLTQLFGYLGSCMAAGIVLGLDEEEHVAAMGLAYMQLAGGKEAGFGVGSNARSIYTGFSAMSGVQSALLARAGMVGPASCLDGKAGMLALYLGMTPSQQQLAELLDPAIWRWSEAGIKPWPCCRSSHPYVSVALDLSRQVAAEQIEKVTVAVDSRGANLCVPEAARRAPATLPDAKYSIPFVTAFALVKGGMSLQTLDESALGDPAVLALARRVHHEQSLAERPGPASAEIRVELKDGSIRAGKLASGMLLADEEVRSKFLSCLGYAGAGNQAQSAWERLQRMDTLMADDLFDCLPAPGPLLE